MSRQVLDPHKLFQPGDKNSQRSQRFLIVLNQPIASPEVFDRCYRSSAWRIYADGGANQVRELEERVGGGVKYAPHIIPGDLDSITSATRTHYKSASQAPVIAHDPDQYSTDFGKAVKWVIHLRTLGHGSASFKNRTSATTNGADVPNGISSTSEASAVAKDMTDVIVFGSLGGRVDQGLGLLGEMGREEEKAGGSLRFWLVSERNVSWILYPPGITHQQRHDATEWHTIQLSAGEKKEEREESVAEMPLFSPNVGVLPIFGSAKIGMRGFEWDVVDWETSMGGQMSTSNHVFKTSGRVEVKTTERVLFTVEMGPGLLRPSVHQKVQGV